MRQVRYASVATSRFPIVAVQGGGVGRSVSHFRRSRNPQTFIPPCVLQRSASSAQARRTSAAGGALAGPQQFSGLWPGLLSLPLARRMAKRDKKQWICHRTGGAYHAIRRNLSPEETLFLSC